MSSSPAHRHSLLDEAPPPAYRSRNGKPRGLLPRGVFAVLIGASLIWMAVAAVLGLGLSVPSLPSSSGSGGGSSGVDYLYLTIAFNPNNGMDQYFPANFTVPAHSTVVVTILNYDNGTNAVPAVYAQVLGTVGGSAQVSVPSTGQVSTVTSVPIDRISHTFTVPTLGGSSASGTPAVNVPIPASASMLDPVQVTFTLHVGASGSYTWMCMAPCDPGSMTTPGLMTGTLVVE